MRFTSLPRREGVNSGISVYDLTTGKFKKFVKFGTQALALEHDEDRDLVYVTDFGTGKVAVFDGRADEVIGEVEMNGAAANDVTCSRTAPYWSSTRRTATRRSPCPTCSTAPPARSAPPASTPPCLPRIARVTTFPHRFSS